MYTIETLPSPILRKVVSPVSNINKRTPALVHNMMAIMIRNNAVGLAANQIGIGKAVLVWNFLDELGHIINPVIEDFSDITDTCPEGCLSIPDLQLDVVRPSKVLVTGLDMNGNKITIFKDNFIARILQHEIDHLNGITMIDRADPELVPVQFLPYRIAV